MADPDCGCAALPDLAVVPMGGEGLDERVFAALEHIRDHGGDQWWLYLSKCKACGQDWLVAQDERIYDNYYLKRLAPAAARDIIERNRWPDDFVTYERVLRLGRTLSQPWTFLDSRSPALVWTAEDLVKERPDISVEEIAYLLGLTPNAAARLLSDPAAVRTPLILGLVLTVLVAIAAFSLWPFIAQDKCLDSGGAWRNGRCVR